MKPWLYVGAKVVCVDDKPLPTSSMPLRASSVYVVRWVGPFSHPFVGDYIGVRVEGIERGRCPTYGIVDTPFAASRFAPVSTIDTTHQVNLLKKLVEKKTVEA